MATIAGIGCCCWFQAHLQNRFGSLSSSKVWVWSFKIQWDFSIEARLDFNENLSASGWWISDCCEITMSIEEYWKWKISAGNWKFDESAIFMHCLSDWFCSPITITVSISVVGIWDCRFVLLGWFSVRNYLSFTRIVDFNSSSESNCWICAWPAICVQPWSAPWPSDCG
jgi:hypothetical protein